MNLNEKLMSAMKSINVSDLGQAKLQPEKQQKFLNVLAGANPLLDEARRIVMNSHTRDIDRIGYAGKILAAGTEGVAATEGQKPAVNTNKLIAKEFVAVQGLTDSALEDVIDVDFENTIINLMGDQAGYDLGDIFLNGDVTSGLVGWLDKAGNEVDAVAATATTDIEKLFDAMISALPAKYDRKRESFRLYVTRDMENDYRNALRARGTSAGDAAQTKADGLFFKGIAVVVVPTMPAGKAMLVQVDNLVYGIYRDIKIESERSAKARSTDFVLSLRADAHFENEDAVVVATGYTG